MRILVVGLFFVTTACSNAPGRPIGEGPSGGNNFGIGAVDGGNSTNDSDSGNVENPLKPSELCKTLTRTGEVVSELHLAGDPPQPQGGSLATGVYDLVELYSFGQPVPKGDGGADDDGGAEPSRDPVTGRTAQITITVTADTVRRAELRATTDSATGAEATEVSFFTISGSNLELKSACPTVGARKTIAFTGGNGGFMLFADPLHTEIYARRQ
jgi:hypothetical protein